jgi:hypothetical protein
VKYEMSENKEVKVNVEIDEEWLKYKVAEKTIEKDIEINNLKSEKEMLESTLSTIAEKELSAKCSKYNIDQNLPESQKIELVKQKALERSNTATLNSFQTGIEAENLNRDTENLEANNAYELIVELEKRASNNDLTAKKLLAEMTAKVCEKSHEYEWDGTGKDLYRKAKGTPQEQAEIRRKKQQWRMIK